MKSLIGSLIGLVLSVSVGAEPQLEGRVRLSSGQPAVGVQVRLFDLTNLRRFVGTTTDETGHFALPLRAFSTARGTVLPTDFALGQNYPNPFNPSTVIPYQLPAAGHVRLDVFNVLGQRLATLVDAERSAGMHTAQWDATDASGRAVGAGVYIYRLSSGGMTESRRMVLVDGQAGIPAVALGSVQSAVEETAATDLPVYGLTVSGEGLVAYVDPAFRVGVDEADIVLEEYGGSPRMKLTTDRILGDVNNDGQVDAFDALYVLLYSEDSSIALPNNGDISLGDVNGDGQVDLADAVLLATYSVNPSDPSLPPGIGQAVPDLVPPVGETSEEQDTALSHIYWREGWSIYRANLDGSNIETLISGGPNFALDVNGGKIYWTEGRSIRRANLDGSDVEILITSSKYRNLSDIVLDVDGGKIYWMSDEAERSESNIRSANLDGSNIETLITNLWVWEFGLALDANGGKIYWPDSSQGRIYHANLDGSNIETLIDIEEEVFGPTLDVDGGKIYWIRDDPQSVWRRNIQRANLDGSDIETLFNIGWEVSGLALDVDGGKIYWTDPENGEIYRANLDGSDIETLITGLDSPSSVVLGPYYELTKPEEIPTRSPEEARSELAERGIPYSQSSLVAYAQDGDLDVVRLLVEAGLDVNVQPNNSSGSIYHIMRQEDVERLDDLETAWFPQDGDEYNDTPLMKAAGQGHIEVVRFLVEQRTDLNIRNKQEQNALMFAAAGGHLAVVVLLIDSGAIVHTDARTSSTSYSYENGPDTPLMWAAYGGHSDVIQVLLDNGAANGSVAMAWAAYGGHLEVIQVLLDNRVRINSDGLRITALMLAAYGGQLEVVRFLLENGADMYVQTNEWPPVASDVRNIYSQGIGPSALTLAIDQDHAGVVHLLLEHWMWEHGADSRDDYGQTILMFAAAAGDLEMARLLLENGAPVNEQTDDGITALVYAVVEGHVEVASLLLENGAPVNEQTDDGITVLMHAVVEGHVEMARLLLENGAPVNEQTDDGVTVLMHAVVEGHVEMARLLLENGAPVNEQTDNGRTALIYAATEGHVEIARLLLENGAPVNEQTDDSDRTALMYAASEGHVEVVRFLVESGADIHIQDAYSNTTLMYAAFAGHVEVARLLLENGALTNAQAGNGNTALMYAASEGYVEVVRFLVESGADIHIQDANGNTALSIAEARGHQEVVDFLRSLEDTG